MAAKEISKMVRISTTGLGIETEHLPAINGLGNLRAWLAKEVEYMLENKFERLVNALYRMDVSEKKVKKAFTGGYTGAISIKLADLIIEREYQKVISRNKYKRE